VVGAQEPGAVHGWIAGLGTASRYRVVIGHWHSFSYGVVTDAMVEDPAGQRTLYAPTPQLAKFLTTTYRFDDFQVVPGDPAEDRGSCLSAGAVAVAFDELDIRVVKKPR
jgi:hypothetical protein